VALKYHAMQLDHQLICPCAHDSCNELKLRFVLTGMYSYWLLFNNILTIQWRSIHTCKLCMENVKSKWRNGIQLVSQYLHVSEKKHAEA